MTEENNLVETVDEQGNTIKFELYDIVEVDEQEYALLLPLEKDENDEEEEIVLMRLNKDGEDYIFESIDDEDEFNKVAEYVNTMDEDGEE